MHRLPTKSVVHRLRVAALLLLSIYLLAPATAAVMFHSIMDRDMELTWFGVGLIALTLLVMILQWLVSQRTNCPLCMTPVLATRKCEKHRNARTFLGSHRLRVAFGILCINRFRCPFCGEPTILEVRASRRH
ncbi:MAG: hypothetical protein Q8Q59_13990 [Luteolibacter sp.]|jgi:hypothetical protein|nr:hypothetical protein [Luteolibacter sp.]